MSLFETATRNKFRFPSKRGELTVEQVWDVPLASRDGFDLENIAVVVNAELESLATGSILGASPDKKKAEQKAQLEAQLEILKRVHAVKVAEKDAAEKRAANKQKRQKVLEALAEREEGELKGKSKEELLKELAAIDGEDA